MKEFIIESMEHHISRYSVKARNPKDAEKKWREGKTRLLSTGYYELAHEAVIVGADDPSTEIASFDIDGDFPDKRHEGKE